MNNAVGGWRQLLERALERHAELPQARYTQLATIRPDGRPANRTLNFRDWLPDDRLVFTTDARSAKAGHLAATPWGELCWYFVDTREQFRILGRLSVVADNADAELAAVRTRVWLALSDASRQTFTWPPPGQPREADAAFRAPAPHEPTPSFALLIVTPEQVDYLDLRPRPFLRVIYRRAALDWTGETLNP